MTVTREQVVAKAREYIGTPFQHQGRVKGKKGGIDCVGLVMCVAEELGIVGADGQPMLRGDYFDYSAEPIDGYVHVGCKVRLVPGDMRDIRPGDIACMKIPTEPCHTAIISENGGALYVIHAYNGGKCLVVEHILDKAWLRRICGVFHFVGVA